MAGGPRPQAAEDSRQPAAAGRPGLVRAARELRQANRGPDPGYSDLLPAGCALRCPYGDYSPAAGTGPADGYNLRVLTGTVVEYHREFCWVRLSEDHREIIAKPRARLELDEQKFARQISIGDQVRVAEQPDGAFAIEEILPRETWLLRRNLGSFKRKPQCIVANADQLAVVVATKPDLRVQVVDRYFLAAIQGGLHPLLVVNKLDLDPECRHNLVLQNYADLGYRVVFTSCATKEGIEELREQLKDKLTAFCGHSGVGKSSLLRLLCDREDINIGDVNEMTTKGRQTTTTSRAYSLPGGGDVVDTPGIREFGIHEMDWTEIHEYFADISALSRGCGFQDCLHKTEPGCAVKAALAGGKLAPERLESYIKLQEEADVRHWER